MDVALYNADRKNFTTNAEKLSWYLTSWMASWWKEYEHMYTALTFRWQWQKINP
jgi:hypothetical protein